MANDVGWKLIFDQRCKIKNRSPYKKDVGLTFIGLSYRTTKVSLSMLHVGFFIKNLNEVEIAVIGLIELIMRKLKINCLSFFCPDDPGTVHWSSPFSGMTKMLF